MPKSCEGRVAIVTGASRGMGQAFVCRLAAEGARVAVIGRDASTRNTELAGSLEETAELVAQVAGRDSVLVRHRGHWGCRRGQGADRRPDRRGVR